MKDLTRPSNEEITEEKIRLFKQQSLVEQLGQIYRMLLALIERTIK